MSVYYLTMISEMGGVGSHEMADTEGAIMDVMSIKQELDEHLRITRPRAYEALHAWCDMDDYIALFLRPFPGRASREFKLMLRV